MKAFLIRLSKVLLKLAMDTAVRQALPKIYQRLDAELPQVLSLKPAPVVVEALVAQAIAGVTEHRPTETQIQAVLGLYDPMRAALRNLKR